MAFPLSSLLCLLLLLLIAGAAAAGTLTLGFDFHHRFSEPVRRWSELTGKELPGGWPEGGSPEYYSALAGQDLAGGALAAGGGDGGGAPALAFSEGNATLKVNSLGFLYYALVSVGTPSVTFMVALDTGSDLFWLPCDCTNCAPTESSNNGFNTESTFYNPNASFTSKRLPCNSDYCGVQNGCSESKQCPYKIIYVSADTSSSGFLVEDILYLTTEDSRPEIVEAQIVFGCGQTQTGSFINAAAPNGLLGLGLEKVSVPSILSRRGLTSDSFSMCFGMDGIGRISFGDQGSSDQYETPLLINPIHPTYNISVTGLTVGNSSKDLGFTTLFDTGTSFTYLADPAYTFLTGTFDEQVQGNRHGPDPRIPFEFCYNISSNDTTNIQPPNISLTTEGGALFAVSEPGLIISIQQHESVYCLAVVKSTKLNIIGQNFMTGHRVVFDRERKVLGWKKFNCYDIEDSNPLPVNPRNSTLSPSIPENYRPEDTKESRNNNNNNNTNEVTSLTLNRASNNLKPLTISLSVLCLLSLTVF